MAADNSILDFTYLQQIAPPNSGLVEEMIELCLQNIPEYLENLSKAYERHDLEGVRKAAHKMKNSVNYIGVEELYRRLQRVENEIYMGKKSENLQHQVAEIKNMSRRALKELQLVRATVPDSVD